MATTRERQRLETAATVLNAAGTLFLTRGFAQTTIREIAEACGVSVGTVMAVGDKDALLVAVLDERIRQVHTQRSESRGLDDGLDHVESISRRLDPFVTLFTSHPALAREYASILVGGNHRSVVFTELASLLIQDVSAILIASGCTTEERAATIAEAVYFAYIGRLFTWPTDADDDADRLRQELRRLSKEWKLHPDVCPSLAESEASPYEAGFAAREVEVRPTRSPLSTLAPVARRGHPRT